MSLICPYGLVSEIVVIGCELISNLPLVAWAWYPSLARTKRKAASPSWARSLCPSSRWGVRIAMEPGVRRASWMVAGLVKV